MFYISDQQPTTKTSNPKRRRPRKRTRTRRPKRPAGEVVVNEGTSFSELALSEELLGALQELGFERATPIQAGTIPVALEGRDLIGQAQTGSGKTAAYGLAMLQRLPRARQGVEGLVICPTRELAAQVTAELDRLAGAIDVRLLAAVGGHDISIQSAALQHGVDIVVGTPGRLMDLMYRGALDLGAVSITVLDEADEMLKMGFIDDVEMILSCLPVERQTLLFSATMPDRLRRLAQSFLRNAAHITVENTRENLPDIDQRYATVTGDERDRTLCAVLKGVAKGQAIVFCRTKSRVHHVTRVISSRFEKVGSIEGDMSQQERDRMMRLFRRGQVHILVATDVLARGIDVQNVACVINYDCPRDADTYVHRVGRTARAGASGSAVTLIEPGERRLLRSIEKRVGKLTPLRPSDLNGHALRESGFTPLELDNA